MKLLLRAYPRWWRERYEAELLALLEAGPLTWRVRMNVVGSGLGERLGGSGRPHLRVFWAWSLFVVGGMAFQRISEHWQAVVPGGDRGFPTAAFDTVQVAAVIGSLAVLAAVALALPAFLRDLRKEGWTALRRPLLTAATGTVAAGGALIAVALGHDLVAVSAFIAFALFSLFAWTHAAVLAARRQEQQRAHSYLALTTTATMAVMTTAAVAWFAAVTSHAPSFVGAAQLAVMATFMLTGTALAAAGVNGLRS